MVTVDVRIPADTPVVIAEGSRNVTMTRLAGALRAQGLGGQALLEVLERENRARCNPPLPAYEVASIARSVGKYDPGEIRDPYITKAAPRTPLVKTGMDSGPKRDPWRVLEPPGDAWQARAQAFAEYASGELWRDAEALAYLQSRGLTKPTIRAAGLGYNPKELRDRPGRWGLSGGAVWLPAGWTIPNEAGGVMWGVNVRRQGDASPKYVMIRGSKRKVYGLALVGHHSDLVIVEGEYDALLLCQETGAVISVVALGGAENRLDIDSLRTLAGFRRWWVATDQDDAGRAAQAALLEASARARPLQLPRADCKDVTEVWAAGEDLAAWIVGMVGPEDPMDYLRWAEHYMNVLDEAAFNAGTKRTPELRAWLALLDRYNETARERRSAGRPLEGAYGESSECSPTWAREIARQNHMTIIADSDSPIGDTLAAEIAAYTAYAQACRARGEVPLQVADWRNVGRPGSGGER